MSPGALLLRFLASLPRRWRPRMGPRLHHLILLWELGEACCSASRSARRLIEQQSRYGK